MFRGRRNDGSSTRPRRRKTVRPANAIAAVVGILSIALGVWALVKTGLNTDHIFTPTTDVLGLPHTPTLALGEIGFGLLLLFAAATGAFGTFLIAILGIASIVVGVIVVSDSWPGKVRSWTAASHDTGWIFILIGAVLTVAAVLPVFVSKRTRTAAPVVEPERPRAAEAWDPTAPSEATVRDDSPEPTPDHDIDLTQPDPATAVGTRTNSSTRDAEATEADPGQPQPKRG